MLTLIKRRKVKDNKTFVNFYLKQDNGDLVAIKPSFDKGFYALNALAIWDYKEDE